MRKNKGSQKKDKASLRCPQSLEELRKFLGVDSLPGSPANQEIFLKWVQEKFRERGDLEWLQEGKEFQLARLADTERDSDEDLDEIAATARFDGFIQPLNLARILAAGEDSKKILPKLWEIFRCNFSGREINADTPNRLKAGWFKLLLRLTGIGSIPPNGLSDRYWTYPILGRLPAMLNYLKLYNRDSATAELKLKRIKGRIDADFIKLEDFKEYLTDIRQAFKIDFPLPKRLFPPTPEPSAVLLFQHDEDFRTVSYSGKTYSLTSRQADVIQMLFKAWENKMPDVPVDRILEKLGSPASRLRDMFKSRPSVWKDLIRSNRKGTVRLNIS